MATVKLTIIIGFLIVFALAFKYFVAPQFAHMSNILDTLLE